MTQPFNKYAEYYDRIYADKDYAAEAVYLHNAFSLYGQEGRKVCTILDLGCGTGNHAIELGKHGYLVKGVDISEQMIEVAKSKIPPVIEGDPNVRIKFIRADIRYFDLLQEFDAVILMFAVMSYMKTNLDVQDTFDVISKHLKPGGVFVFDCWFGPAVLNIKPETKIKRFNGDSLLRVGEGHLLYMENAVNVSYTIGKGTEIIVDEDHEIRYFFPPELRLFAGNAGLKIDGIHPFPFLEGEPTLDDWNVSVIGHKPDGTEKE